MKTKQLLALLVSTGALFSSCNDDGGEIDFSSPETVGYYVLCEGTWGQDNGSLAWYDLATRTLRVDYYSTQNPSQIIGDTPHDLKIYGTKMYCTAWGEDQVLVMNAADAKLIAAIPVDDPRSIAHDQGMVYVSSYDNKVVRIDTVTLAVTGTAFVTGSYCEGIAVKGDNIYVANNATVGGFQGSGNTISVINKNNMQQIAQIIVPLNPVELIAATDGYLYLTTWGNYTTVDAQLHRIDLTSNTLIYTFPGLNAGHIAATRNYLYTSQFSYITFEPYSNRVDPRTDAVSTFGTAGEVYYGVGANPASGYVYYLGEGGSVSVFDPTGTEAYQLAGVGLRPTAVAFLLKRVSTPSMTGEEMSGNID